MDDSFNEIDDLSQKLTMMIRKIQNNTSEPNFPNLRLLLTSFKKKVNIKSAIYN